MGWIGRTDQVEYALGVIGADKDEDGRFLVYGEPPATFLGLGDEMVISDKTDYSVGGHRASLAGLMNSTSYGIGVQVIG